MNFVSEKFSSNTDGSRQPIVFACITELSINVTKAVYINLALGVTCLTVCKVTMYHSDFDSKCFHNHLWKSEVEDCILVCSNSFRICEFANESTGELHWHWDVSGILSHTVCLNPAQTIQLTRKRVVFFFFYFVVFQVLGSVEKGVNKSPLSLIRDTRQSLRTSPCGKSCNWFVADVAEKKMQLGL